MAARKRKLTLDDKWREKIRTSMLVNRLQDHAIDEKKTPLSKSQVRAIEILLKKTAPDLSSTTLTGKDGKDLIPEKITLELIDANTDPKGV